MRNFEPTLVLRPDEFRTGCGEARSGRLSAEHTAAAPLVRERGSRFVLLGMWQKRSVDSVNTVGFGLGRTSAGLARIAYVFWSSQCWRGLECGSSPTSGTADPLVRGDFCF
jgi:hypothetical protein